MCMYVTCPVCMLLMTLHCPSFCLSLMMFVRAMCNAQMHGAPVPVIQTAWQILLCSSTTLDLVCCRVGRQMLSDSWTDITMNGARLWTQSTSKTSHIRRQRVEDLHLLPYRYLVVQLLNNSVLRMWACATYVHLNFQSYLWQQVLI